MTFFLDNCIPVALHEILKKAECDAVHLQDLWPDSQHPNGVGDEIWIPDIGQRGWVLVSGDHRILTHPGLSVALKKAHIVSYFAYRGFTGLTTAGHVRWLFRAWENIENHAKNAARGRVYEVRSDGKIVEKHLRGR